VGISGIINPLFNLKRFTLTIYRRIPTLTFKQKKLMFELITSVFIITFYLILNIQFTTGQFLKQNIANNDVIE